MSVDEFTYPFIKLIYPIYSIFDVSPDKLIDEYFCFMLAVAGYSESCRNLGFEILLTLQTSIKLYEKYFSSNSRGARGTVSMRVSSRIN